MSSHPSLAMAQATAMLMTNNTMNNVNYTSSNTSPIADISSHPPLYWPGMMTTSDWRDKMPLHG